MFSFDMKKPCQYRTRRQSDLFSVALRALLTHHTHWIFTLFVDLFPHPRVAGSTSICKDPWIGLIHELCATTMSHPLNEFELLSARANYDWHKQFSLVEGLGQFFLASRQKSTFDLEKMVSPRSLRVVKRQLTSWIFSLALAINSMTVARP